MSRTEVGGRLDEYLHKAACSTSPSGWPHGHPVRIDGKHLALNNAAFRVRGVTYGSFAPRGDGERFPPTATIRRDIAHMAELGLNALRTYELPPPDLLDAAAEAGLRVLVGLEYADWRAESVGARATGRVLSAGQRAVDAALQRCHGRPEVLAVAVGNEIPVDLVRLHGRSSVERILVKLVERVHAGTELLATYVNFPTTEFLQVPNQDFVCFNVFLERPVELHRYLDHLQTLAGPKPVVVTELGLGAAIHGEETQATSLGQQLNAADEAALAGAFVFSWTDDWVVAGQAVDGWGFGITDAERREKPVAHEVRRWCRRPVPRCLRDQWPHLSIVVCAYNEERHIEQCLASLQSCDYPGLEVIVCDDGSTDRTLELARTFPFEVLALERGGLSRARNAGLLHATGELVAYLDADAACHPEWPYHLALSLESDEVVATGGPNLPFVDVALVERAVALSPGSPSEVLLGPGRAEHVPGCNMAFRHDVLLAQDGFDPQYDRAGDDVDICWRLLDQGHQIGFAPAAQVRHHRRPSVGGFLRQQRGYGRAERMLIGPHRHRVNRLGQPRWRGFVYGPTALLPTLLRPVVYTGWMGTAPFQPVISRPAMSAVTLIGASVPFLAAIGLLGLLGALAVPSMLWVGVSCAAALVAYGAAVAMGTPAPAGEPHPVRLRFLVGLLTVLQPMARTWGRLSGRALAAPVEPEETWVGDRATWLRRLQRACAAPGIRVSPGPSSSFWDLEVTDGGPVAARITTAVIWSWEPRWRVRYRPRRRWLAAAALASVVALAGGATDAATAVLGVLAVMTLLSFLRVRARLGSALASTTAGNRTTGQAGGGETP